MSHADKLFTWLWLSLAGLILLSVRLHLLQMPLERDEGEYALGGWMILQGKMPYTDFYNMKFPGIYLLNALFISLFGGGAAGPHVGLLVFQVGTLALVFALGRQWVSNALAALATLCTALMMLSPSAVALAGHATHYVSFFAVLAALLFTRGIRQGRVNVWLWLGAGLAAALAVLMKQQGAFVALGLGVALLSEWLRKRLTARAFFARTALLLIGFALPMLAVVAWLAARGAWADTLYWCFDYAGAYSGMLPMSGALVRHIWDSVRMTVEGTWLFWLIGVAGALLALVRRQPLGRNGLPAVFLLLALVSVTPGMYFRPHYFIVCFPFLCLSIVNWLQCHAPQLRRWGWIFSLLALGPVVGLFHRIWWVASPDQAVSMIYGNTLFVQAARTGAYLRAHVAPGDQVLVVGSEPEIAYLAQMPPATPFLYWYTHDDDHRLQPQLRSKFKVQAEVSAPTTRWVVMVNDLFSLYHYPVKPNETVSWLNQHLRRHQYQPQWTLTTPRDALNGYTRFALPQDLKWDVFEGESAQRLQLPAEMRYITVFRRQ